MPRVITISPGEEILIQCGPAKTAAKNPLQEAADAECGFMMGVKAPPRKTRKLAGGKRKMNPFMKFAQGERKTVVAENPSFAIPEIGKELGKRWRALSDAEKKRYA